MELVKSVVHAPRKLDRSHQTVKEKQDPIERKNPAHRDLLKRCLTTTYMQNSPSLNAQST